jgi:hypothetical protein
MTTENWSELLFYTQEVMSFNSFVIFVIVILSGAGILVNLMIGPCRPLLPHAK